MKRNRRGISFGTVFMLCLTVIAVGGSAFVFSRLSGGGAVDLGRVAGALQLGTGEKQEIEDIRIRQGSSAADSGGGGQETETAPRVTASPRQPSADGATGPRDGVRRAELTFGGTAAIETEIRRSCYYNDTKKYDFSDLLSPLRGVFQADWSCFFLENILSDDYKVNATIVPTEAAKLVTGAGVSAAACGFPGIYDKGSAGLASTRKALEDQGVTALGISEDSAWTEVNGISLYIRQYTGTMSASARKSLAKNGEEYAVPAADIGQIRADLTEARSEADVVIVLVHWGKDGKNPDRAQQELARQIAEAGADIIIGSGSRLPQAAELITVTGESGESHTALCAYSLGTLISDNRKNAKRLGSYLVHASIEKGEGKAKITGMSYTPVYAWRYRQDGKTFYRCVPIDGTAPDGMDSEQMKTMEKAGNAVADALTGSPLMIRSGNGGGR